MFKSFALALLVATTQAAIRGANDGSDQVNAMYRDMINSSDCGNDSPVQIDLWTYIQKTEGEDAYEYHGDTVATFTGAMGANIQYGWCMHMTTDADDNKVWDCQQVDVKVPESDVAEVADFKTQGQSQAFTSVTDWQYTGTRNNFSWANVKAAGTTAMVRDQVADSAGVLSESAQTTANHNWAISGAKSFTNCSSKFGRVTCVKPEPSESLEDRMKGGINLHWFRNFQTSDAPGYDIQFSGATDKGEQYEVFAYLWSWFDAVDFPTKEPSEECLNDPSTAAYYVTPITEAAWTKVYKEPEVAPVVEEDEEVEEDHATMATISTTALLSAIYTLAF